MQLKLHEIIEFDPGDQERAVISNTSHLFTAKQLNDSIDYFHQVFSETSSLFDSDKQDSKPGLLLVAVQGGPLCTALQLAAWKAGWAVTFLPPELTKLEAEHYLEIIKPNIAAVEVDNKLREALTKDCLATITINKDQVPEVQFTDRETNHLHDNGLPQNTRQLQFTSGTTGKPKCMVLSDRNITSNIENHRAYFGSDGHRSVFCPMPQFHAMGGAVVLEHLLSGDSIHTSNHYLPGADLEILETRECDTLVSTPNYFQLALQFGLTKKKAFRALDRIVLGSAPASPDLLDNLANDLPDTEIFIRYGLSEAYGALSYHHFKPNLDFNPGNIGYPLSSVKLITPDSHAEEEIVVNSETVSIGALTSKSTFVPQKAVDTFNTGDTGVIDQSSGELIIKGRNSQFIKCNGYRIEPMEIEFVLKSHPEINEAAVVGIEDQLMGEKICALVEKAGGSDLNFAELRAYCKSNLSIQKIPQIIKIVCSIPKNRVGKPELDAVKSLLKT